MIETVERSRSVIGIEMSFKLPRKSEYYISLQRTQYQLPLMRTLEKFLPQVMVHGPILRWIEKFRRGSISELYYQDMLNEVETLMPFLVARPVKILDIGCGIGGVDVLIDRLCEGAAEFYLLDKTQIDKIYYGMKPRAAFYNDFQLSRQFLAENDVALERVHFVEVGDGRIRSTGQTFDLIFSLISWGFHYPLSTYLEEALSALAPSGVIVLDLRRADGSLETLRSRADIIVSVLFAHHKYDRISIRRRDV